MGKFKNPILVYYNGLGVATQPADGDGFFSKYYDFKHVINRASLSGHSFITCVSSQLFSN